MKWHLSVAIVLVLIFTGSWGIAQELMAANPKRGQAIYEQLCLRCHGAKLDGKGPEAQFLSSRPADLQSLSSQIKSDWELLIIISHGVLFTPMHAYRDILSEQETRDVLSYIRMIAPFAPIS
jgi:mono/diheme cytochrome c family protein